MLIARLAYAQWGDGHARFHAQFRLHRAWHSNRMHAFGGGAGFPQTPLTELLRQARHPFELQDQPQGSHSIIDVAAAGRKLALRARPIRSDLARNLHIPADYGGCRSKSCAGRARL